MKHYIKCLDCEEIMEMDEQFFKVFDFLEKHQNHTFMGG